MAALLLTAAVAPAKTPTAPVVLENAHIRYTVNSGGRCEAFVNRATGLDQLAKGGETPVCTLQKGGRTYESTSLTDAEGLWRIAFGDAGVAIDLRVAAQEDYFTFEVVALSGSGVDALNFLYLPLGDAAQSGRLACTALALNLQTKVAELPGPMKRPLATCYPRFGMAGAKVALIAVPPEQLRETLKTVMEAEDQPRSALGGPWALDAEINRGSYLIDTEGELGEDTVDEWIALAHNLGMKQIDLHTGKSLRFGDLAPNPARYPNGLDGVKAVVDKLHAAGLSAGLHTYAFYIAKDTPWVTPIPDRRLGAQAAFTVAADIDEAAVTVPVLESTAGVSTTTGFQVRNSVTLRIDDELIVFSGASATPPFGFTQCGRGALGSTAAPHRKGAEAVQLKECFGLFAPDGDSSLLPEVAARTASVYNDCGFDMIYLDALDGSDVLAGGENAWHYAAKFVFALNEVLERPALFEMSTMEHHLWKLRSRMGAWDVPARGAQRLADIHVLANQSATRMFLPANLGWAGIFDWNPVQPERTYPDDVEHLCARALAADSSLSLLVGFTPNSWARSANVRRLGGIIRRYETLRLAQTLPASLRATLQESGAPFVIEQDGDQRWGARQRHTVTHTVTSAGLAVWTVDNPFAAQPPKIRMELLAGLERPEGGNARLLAAGPDAVRFGEPETADGVAFSIQAGEAAPGDAIPSLALTADNQRAPRHSAWAGATMRFATPMDLQGRGIGLMVRGDGKGAVLNVQLQSTIAAAGGRANYFVDLDFTGWRYVELVEPESARLGEYGWPFSQRHASWEGDVPFIEVLRDYIVWTHYGQIDNVSLWLNNLPPGESVACLVGPLMALPVQRVELDGLTIQLGGQQIRPPGVLRSGDYVEISPTGLGSVFDPVGELRQSFSMPALPTLGPGNNEVRLEIPGNSSARLRISLTTFGNLTGGE